MVFEVKREAMYERGTKILLTLDVSKIKFLGVKIRQKNKTRKENMKVISSIKSILEKFFAC